MPSCSSWDGWSGPSLTCILDSEGKNFSPVFFRCVRFPFQSWCNTKFLFLPSTFPLAATVSELCINHWHLSQRAHQELLSPSCSSLSVPCFVMPPITVSWQISTLLKLIWFPFQTLSVAAPCLTVIPRGSALIPFFALKSFTALICLPAALVPIFVQTNSQTPCCSQLLPQSVYLHVSSCLCAVPLAGV